MILTTKYIDQDVLSCESEKKGCEDPQHRQHHQRHQQFNGDIGFSLERLTVTNKLSECVQIQNSFNEQPAIIPHALSEKMELEIELDDNRDNMVEIRLPNDLRLGSEQRQESNHHFTTLLKRLKCERQRNKEKITLMQKSRGNSIRTFDAITTNVSDSPFTVPVFGTTKICNQSASLDFTLSQRDECKVGDNRQCYHRTKKSETNNKQNRRVSFQDEVKLFTFPLICDSQSQRCSARYDELEHNDEIIKLREALSTAESTISDLTEKLHRVETRMKEQSITEDTLAWNDTLLHASDDIQIKDVNETSSGQKDEMKGKCETVTLTTGIICTSTSSFIGRRAWHKTTMMMNVSAYPRRKTEGDDDYEFLEIAREDSEMWKEMVHLCRNDPELHLVVELKEGKKGLLIQSTKVFRHYS